MNNDLIKKEGSFNSRVIELDKAVKDGNTPVQAALVEEFRAKKAYYDGVTLENIREEVDNCANIDRKKLSKEEKSDLNNKLVQLRSKIVEKKEFYKNHDLVEEINNGDYYTLLPKKARSIKLKRGLKVAGVVGSVILVALAAKGCKNNKNSKTSNTTTATSVVTVIGDNNDSVNASEMEPTATISSTETIETTDYVIDPVIGEATNVTYITSGNNTTSTNVTSESTSSTIGTGPTASETSTVIINDDGSVSVIVDNPNVISDYVAPTETTIQATLPDTTPTGTDPLPTEPTVIVQSDDGIDDRPAVITVTPTPMPVVTPTIPSGDIEGQESDITTYPTEASQTVPTDATSPDPTFETTPTETTVLPTLPPIDDMYIDADDEDITVYTFDDKTANITKSNNFYNNFRILEFKDNTKVEILEPAAIVKSMGLRK